MTTTSQPALSGLLNSVGGNVFADLAPALDRGEYGQASRLGTRLVTSPADSALDVVGMRLADQTKQLVRLHDAAGVGLGTGAMLSYGVGKEAAGSTSGQKHALHVAGNVACEAERTEVGTPGAAVLMDVSGAAPTLWLLPGSTDSGSALRFGYSSSGHDATPQLWPEPRKVAGAEWVVRSSPVVGGGGGGQLLVETVVGGTVCRFSPAEEVAPATVSISPARVSAAYLGASALTSQVAAFSVSIPATGGGASVWQKPRLDFCADQAPAGRTHGCVGSSLVSSSTAPALDLLGVATGSGKRMLTAWDYLGVGVSPPTCELHVAGNTKLETLTVTGPATGGGVFRVGRGWAAGALDATHTYRALDVASLVDLSSAGVVWLSVASASAVVATFQASYIATGGASGLSLSVISEHVVTDSRPDGRPRLVVIGGTLQLYHEIDHVACAVTLGCTRV